MHLQLSTPDSDVEEFEASRRREHKNECWCVDPDDPCYRDHYAGKCGCDCEDCGACDCNCVLLARLDRVGGKHDYDPVWNTDHRVRRFIRPVLMRDPQVQIEEKQRKRDKEQAHGEEYEREQYELAEEEQEQMAQEPAGAGEPAQEPQTVQPIGEGGGVRPSGGRPPRKPSSRRS